MRIEVRGTVGGHASRTWDMFGAFGNIADWHPLIADSVLESAPGPGGGPVRAMVTGDRGRIREELLVSDSVGRRLGYEILESPFSVRSYRAEVLVLESGTPGSCEVLGATEFEPVDLAKEAALGSLFEENVFKAGIEALNQVMGARRG